MMKTRGKKEMVLGGQEKNDCAHEKYQASTLPAVRELDPHIDVGVERGEAAREGGLSPPYGP